MRKTEEDFYMLDIMSSIEMQAIFNVLREFLMRETLAEVEGKTSSLGLRELNVIRVFMIKLIDRMRKESGHPRLVKTADAAMAPAELVNLGLHKLLHNPIAVLQRYADNPDGKGTLAKIAEYFLKVSMEQRYTH